MLRVAPCAAATTALKRIDALYRRSPAPLTRPNEWWWLTRAVDAQLPSAATLADDADVASVVRHAEALSLIDLNWLLYRCDAEERATSGGRRGAYDVPAFGALFYCGFQGSFVLFC